MYASCAVVAICIAFNTCVHFHGEHYFCSICCQTSFGSFLLLLLLFLLFLSTLY